MIIAFLTSVLTDYEMQYSIEETGAAQPNIRDFTGVVSKYNRIFGRGQIKAIIDGQERKFHVKKIAIVTPPHCLVKNQKVSFQTTLPLTEKPEALKVVVQYGDGVANFGDTTTSEDPEFDAVLLHSNESLLVDEVFERHQSELTRNTRNDVSYASSTASMLSTNSRISVEETAVPSDVRFVVEENTDLDILTVQRVPEFQLRLSQQSSTRTG